MKERTDDMLARKRPHRSALVLVILGLTLIVVGCDWNREALPCDCPHLEQIVDNINWAPGLELSMSEDWRDGSLLGVQQVWDGPRADLRYLDRLAEALEGAGFQVDRSEPRRVTGTLGDLVVHGGSNEPVGELEAEFFVRVTAPEPDSDDLAAQLEPLMRVLYQTELRSSS